MRTLRPSIYAVARVISISLVLSVSIAVQGQNPAPPAAPAAPAAGGDRSFSDNLVALLNRAEELLPIFQNQVETPLLAWLETVSLGLAAAIIMFSFARIWRENAGAGADLFWWFGRLAVCFMLLGSGPYLINQLAKIGQDITVGDGGNGALQNFYITHRDQFDDRYVLFSEGLFTVRGQTVAPTPGGVWGVIFSTESSIPDAARKLDKISRDMSLLYDGLSLARGVLSFGDLYLMLLSSFLLIALRLAAPIMIALAIDRNLAQKISYPFLWGVVVITLIWPVVALIIKSLAYLAANVAMAVGDQGGFFKFDEKTLQIIQSTNSNPVYTVLIAAMIMLIAGLSLWLSPIIAYQLSAGRVYESVSTTISGWAGAIVGAGVEYYSAQMASAINNQAERAQAQGAYDSTVTQAGSVKEGSDISARANKIRGSSAVEGNRVGGLYATEAARYNQAQSARADAMFGQRATNAGVDLQNNLATVGMAQSKEELRIGWIQQHGHLGAQATREGWNIQAGGVEGFTRQIPVLSPATGPLGTVGGAWMRAYGTSEGINKEIDTIGKANRDRGSNIDAAYKGTVQAQEGYRKEMNLAQDGYKENRVFIAGTAAQINKDGVNRSAGIAQGGISQGYRLDLQANTVNYLGAVKGAGQLRDASFEAARLRAHASVVSAVGHNVARNAEQGLTLRY